MSQQANDCHCVDELIGTILALLIIYGVISVLGAYPIFFLALALMGILGIPFWFLCREIVRDIKEIKRIGYSAWKKEENKS